ncbi:TonB-dependent receptor [[Leptolyngbya] sp. PCC 7376]|uniref:TonB-dependent receptor n=1 Tax=[Leptolyngbya] sp. PCC 7376 TaxID=111781 RepID=UPI00135866DD|nr:TonB-dependent receptor [[Leptolyngbya] sp. PCC 7376]
MASSVVVALAPAVNAQKPITDIQLLETEAGLKIQLISPVAIADVTETVEGNQLIIEILNAQLDGILEQSLLSEPNRGIASVSFSQQPNNILRLIIEGSRFAPFVDVITDGTGLVVQILPDDLEDEDLELIVTATRTEEEPDKVPRSVTVISSEEIESQTALNSNLSTILGKLVPGLSTGTETSSNFGQTLRGRNISVLIDGVPQSTNRNAQRDLRTIDPSAIERVEIIRGPSALYGDGATGGIINIITKSGAGQPFVSRTEIGTKFSLTELDNSFGYTLSQSISGSEDKLSYAASGSLTTSNNLYDSNGDLIPPTPTLQGGLGDVETLNLAAKIGYDISETQNIQFNFNYYNDSQDSDLGLTFQNFFPTLERATAIPGLELPDQPDTENIVLNFAYTNKDILGSRLDGQLYYRDYSTRFYPFAQPVNSPPFNFLPIQSEVESEKIGGRLDIETPLSKDESLEVLWGVDYDYEDTSQPVDIFDPAAVFFSNGLVFNPVGISILSPPLQQSELGLFAQLNWDVSDSFNISGGIRQEFIGIELDDFTTILGADVGGGALDYDATLFNVGAVYAFNDEVSLFGNFSQGFSVADVARVLRTAAPGFNVEDLRPEAQKVDSYELGIRGNWDKFQASLTGFYSFSNLGSTFGTTSLLDIVRDPLRVYGLEADLRAQVSNQVALGGTLTLTQGERDTDFDGDFDTDSSSFVIPPLKLTGFVEFSPTDKWQNRFQVNIVGDRDAEANGVIFQSVDGYVTADLISQYETDFGTFQLGIENIFNTDYFPITAQAFGGFNQYAGQGTTVSLKYGFDW